MMRRSDDSRIARNRIMRFRRSAVCLETNDDDGEEGAEPDRQACWRTRTHAPDDAWHESGKARRRAWPHFSAGAEIRKGRKPHWRKSLATDFAHPPGAGLVLLRGRAERTGTPFVRHVGSSLPGLCVGFSRYL